MALRLPIGCVVLTAFIVSGTVYSYEKSQQRTSESILQAQLDSLKNELALSTKTSSSSSLRADWRTYTNPGCGYSIDYPTDWAVREFPDSKTGADFTPPNSTVAPIMIDCLKKSTSGATLSFDDYVSRAASFEIQGYQQLDTKQAITTNSGAKGYKTIWNVLTLQGQKTLSEPITYFQPADSTEAVQVRVNDPSYLETYTRIVSTYKE